ncbi:putative Proton-coupled amino acid transporter [Daphnia magna]|uniref:Putative Proton-coupled amino acid transporter n=1 Tax=Daphnia magna TaxID=35525 RepID=A0A164NQ01_9CRUS|nr:putative Proton-coupled amino acid transporter [Daphnia magna]
MKQTVFSIDLIAENGENFKQDCPFDFDTKEESRDAGSTCNPSETTIIAQETPTNSNCDINPVLQRSISSRSHYSNTLSTGRTLLYLIKGNLGAGLFAIPAAFKDAGLVGGSIGVPLMALLSIHCMHMLVKCTEVLKSRCGDPDMAMDYSQVIETACLTGPQKMAKFATIAKRTIKISSFIKDVAFCSVFILFAGYYLRQLVSYFYPELSWTIRYWTAVMSIPALAMACIRNHEHLHTLSYLASSIKAISLVVLFVYIFKDDLPHISERPAFSVAAHLLLYYGTVIFAFEGVTQVLPLHDNMRTTRHFRKWNGVLNTGMVLIGCLYFTLGFYGYLKYGEATYPSITMNLPKDEIACQVVKIGLIVALLINYAVGKQEKNDTNVKLTDILFVFVCVGLPKKSAVSVALITENLELLMSLTGALTCTFLCLLFPPTLDIITFWNYMGWFRLAKNIFIILLSFAAFASGTLAAVMAFENYFVKEDFLYGDRATT